MTSDETLELLRSAVALRVEGRKVPERVRRALAHTEQTILGIVGPLVRKRVAARLLGCSVQALDRWIAKGAIPVEPIAPGASRTAIPTADLVDIAYEQALVGPVSLAASISATHERRWSELEVGNADRLIAFASQIEEASWNHQSA